MDPLPDLLVADMYDLQGPVTTLWRIYRPGGAHPAQWNTFRTYGPMRAMRWDHHCPSSDRRECETQTRDPAIARAIWYGAASITTAVAETFAETRTIRTDQGHWVAHLQIPGPLQILNLATSTWPTRAHIDKHHLLGDKCRTRALSRLIYARYTPPPALHGVTYLCRFGTDTGVGLYETALPHFPAAPIETWPLGDPSKGFLLDAIAVELGYDVYP